MKGFGKLCVCVLGCAFAPVGADAANTGVPSAPVEMAAETDAPPTIGETPFEDPDSPGEAAPPPDWGPLRLVGEEIPPGSLRRLRLSGASKVGVPLVVLRGVEPGPTLCVTAGVHGDELNGVAIAQRLVTEVDPARLRGSLVVAPIVNTHGFRNGSRYLPDRRDLNRFFPGSQRGSAASRIAHEFFDRVVRGCNHLVDLHTGSLNRANLPQLRGDLRDVRNLRLAWGFGTEHLVHSVGPQGTLRRAAGEAGIAAVLYEAGEPMRFQPGVIDEGVRGVLTLLASLGMTIGADPPDLDQHVYRRTSWVRAETGGIYIPGVVLGQRVVVGAVLAEITDPFSTARSEVRAPRSGRILGMAIGQVVIPGFALFHIGLEEDGEIAGEEGDGQAPPPASEPERDPMRSELIGERPE
jgi:predicted deacylase